MWELFMPDMTTIGEYVSAYSRYRRPAQQMEIHDNQTQW